MVSWGYYERWACTGKGRYRIVIKVLKCRNQESGGYISIQPTFLIPYKQYTFEVVYKVLNLRIKSGLTLRESLARVFKEGVRPGYQAVQHWINGVKESCGHWIGVLQEAGKFTLACPKQGSRVYSPELLHFIIVLEKYLAGAQTDIAIHTLHGKLLKTYRSSPLSSHRLN